MRKLWFSGKLGTRLTLALGQTPLPCETQHNTAYRGRNVGHKIFWRRLPCGRPLRHEFDQLYDCLRISSAEHIRAAFNCLRPLRNIADRHVRYAKNAGFLLHGAAVRKNTESGPLQMNKVKKTQRLNKVEPCL